MYRLLFVNDELDILDIHRAFLEEKGNIVDAVQTATEALCLVRQHDYDGILLDVICSETTGFALCEEIKKLTDKPIIFLSYFTDNETQIHAFSCGAVDYIAKDCSLDLFWAKVDTRLRIDQKRVGETTLSFPLLSLNLKKRELTIDGTLIDLTNIEFNMMSLMCSKPCEVFGSSDFYHHIWGYDAMGTGHGIQVHISRLRGKLEKAFPSYSFVETMRGKGYRFVPMEDN